MKYLNVKQLNTVLHTVIEKRKPFSLIRLGDGEWTVIKWPKFTKDRLCRSRIERWFDVDKITHKDIMSIRNQIERACKNADLLGIPSKIELLYPKWKKFIKLCGQHYRIFNNSQSYFHFYIIKSINYKAIFQGVDEISYISCHNLTTRIKKTFNIPKVNSILIPQEHWVYNKYSRKKNGKIDLLKHYPDLFHKITRSLQSHDLQGKIYLIGAGGLGKIYCNTIKKNGGIALDIGAMFDGWAGYYTRPFLKNPKRFKL